MEYDSLLNTAVDVGYLLLENGAETYRVEESIRRIVHAYGVPQVDVFAIPSCIITTMCDEQGHSITKIKRILSRETNLDKVERVNDLCRRICRDTPDFAQVKQQLEQVRTRSMYSLPVLLLAYVLAGFSFTLVFGGNFADALCAAVCSVAIKLVSFQMERFRTNSFFTNIVCSAVTAAIAALGVSLGLAANMDKIIIGTLMNLVPGVAITNAMRDIIAHDLVSGLTRLTEALLTATAMALGAGIALTLMRML